MRKWIPSILICGSGWALALLLVYLGSPTTNIMVATPAESAGIGDGVVTKVDTSNYSLCDAGLAEILVSKTNAPNPINIAVLVPLTMNFQMGDAVELRRVEHYYASTIQAPQFIAVHQGIWQPLVTK